MQELFHIVQDSGVCSYLPGERWRFDLRAVASMTPAEYANLLARGYRRFGWQVFRPVCPACCECRSLRIPLRKFEPTASHRRVLRQNANVEAALADLVITRDHIDIYNRYQRFMHAHRGWEFRSASPNSFAEQFLSGARDLGRQWIYFERGKMLGVAFMDEAAGAISLVYCFYDPEWRPRSPGTFSILNQLMYGKEMGFDYAYLGYWVPGCQSLAYKERYRPHEILAAYPAEGEEPEWQLVS